MTAWAHPSCKRGSNAQPIVVHDSDVTGIELTLAELGALAGRIALDSAVTDKTCAPADPIASKNQINLETIARDTIIVLRRDEQNPAELFAVSSAFETLPSNNNEFAFNNLLHGMYRLSARSLREDLYVSGVTSASVNPAKETTKTNVKSALTKNTKTAAPRLKAQSPSAQTTAKRSEDHAARSIPVAGGQRLTNFVVHLARGAARVGGKVRFADAETPLPAVVRVHLIPAEADRANDALRYGETSLAADGTFRFANLAPGSYRLLAIADLDSDSPPATRPLAWDDAARQKLRRAAEDKGMSIELIPCQSATDIALLLRLDANR